MACIDVVNGLSISQRKAAMFLEALNRSNEAARVRQGFPGRNCGFWDMERDT